MARLKIEIAPCGKSPGFRLYDYVGIIRDSIERRVNLEDKSNLGAVLGHSVLLRFEIQECALKFVQLAQRAGAVSLGGSGITSDTFCGSDRVFRRYVF